MAQIVLICADQLNQRYLRAIIFIKQLRHTNA